MMGARGRKSSAETKANLTVIPGGKVAAAQMVSPPKELTEEQSLEWREIVAAMPIGFPTRAQQPLLASYCRHTVALRHIGQLVYDLEQEDELELPEYDRLLKMQERESRMLASMAVRLGIAITTTHERKSSKNIKDKPWDFKHDAVEA